MIVQRSHCEETHPGGLILSSSACGWNSSAFSANMSSKGHSESFHTLTFTVKQQQHQLNSVSSLIQLSAAKMWTWKRCNWNTNSVFEQHAFCTAQRRSFLWPGADEETQSFISQAAGFTRSNFLSAGVWRACCLLPETPAASHQKVPLFSTSLSLSGLHFFRKLKDTPQVKLVF